MHDDLRSIPLFSGLTPEQYAELEPLTTRRHYPRGTVILNEGDHSDSLYLIHAGRVKVLLADEDGREVIITILEPGDHFGELALIDSEPRSACVMAMADCDCTVLGRGGFERFMDRVPRVSANLLRGLAGRLRSANRNIESLALMDVYGRVARLLLEHAEPRDGCLVLRERFTQRELANMVGASREMVSRIFRDLTTGGYITVDNGVITINEKLPPGW